MNQSYLYPLFHHMSEYGLTLTDSELIEILEICKKIIVAEEV